MSKKVIDSPKVFKNIIGESLGTTNWKEVTQKEIDSFAAATEDFQWIHVDKEKVITESPFKKTIAHGYYSLSLIPKFASEVWECKNLKLILNYGTDKVRFISPVVNNSYIRANFTVLNAKDYKGGILLTNKVIIEIKNNEKPALVAETLSLLYY